jgi:CAI-1 autoinducer synthase
MCCGFAVLAQSSFGVNATLGLVTVITFCFAVVADIFILAPLLLICDLHLGVFSWGLGHKSARGEHPALTDRVEAYFKRMSDGHLVVGRVPGEGAVQLWSNDYLGLGGHPGIVKSQVQQLESQSDGVFMSAVFLNETSLQRQFEREMASYLSAPAAVLCQSGWSANTGLVQALVDHRTPVYLDQFAHASLWEGARMAGAQAHAFRHNQTSHLERLIKRNGPGLILVDAIYSAYGTICPLHEITALSESTGCILAVDESHALGVYGPHGEGLVHTLNLTEKVQYRTFSLSKAFATRAGMVAGPERVMTYFPYEARPAIFSSAVLQHEVAALAATLKVVQEEDWRRQRLWHNTNYLRAGLRKLGYAVDQTTSQIISLHSGTEAQTKALRNALEDHGIFGAVFAAPATAKNHAIIRLSVNARLGDSDLDRVIAACRIIAERRVIAPWPKDLLVDTPTVAEADASPTLGEIFGQGSTAPAAGS